MSTVEEAPHGGGGGIAAPLSLPLTSAGREKAEAYLEDQRRLAADQRAMLHLQMEEMRQRNRYEISHLRLRRFSGWARAAFEFSIGLFALALVGGLGVMVWNAAHSEGLVVESFAVPPDLAARGLTGEVVAGRVLDQVRVTMTPGANGNFVNQSQSVSDAWSGDIKVEIPQTGISLGELYRFLRRWLGRETMVGGAVVHTPDGLALTVRAGAVPSATFAGPEAELDRIIVQAAGHFAEAADPVRYAGILSQTYEPSRMAQAQPILERVINDPAMPPRDRASAMNSLGIIYANGKGNVLAQVALLRRARETDPTYTLGYSNAAGNEFYLSRPEAALALLPQAQRLLEDYSETWTPQARARTLAGMRGLDAALKGDHARRFQILQTSAAQTGAGLNYVNQLTNMALSQALLHDGGALAAFDGLPPAVSQGNTTLRLANRLRAEAALEHWPVVVATAAATEQAIVRARGGVPAGRLFVGQLAPWTALAKAKTGDIAGAEKLIATTPADCYDCIRARGMIASEAKQWGRADYWFARAVTDAPSIPFAHEDWGRSLLARGKPDEAIAQFTLANKKGPNFADALQGWGEALMAKNQSHLALAKFAEAEKHTPNWGRLHLKWGQALAYAGKPEEAKAKFARAAQLDLTPAEKAELARQTSR